MATFAGYVVLVVGLSLLLALVGIQTTTGNVLGIFNIDITPASLENNFSVDASGLNGLDSAWFLGIFIGLTSVFGVVVGIRAALGGTFGVAETLKVTSVGSLIALIVLDFVSLFTLDVGGSIGRVVQIIGILIYLPLAVGAIIAAFDWIGGGK